MRYLITALILISSSTSLLYSQKVKMHRMSYYGESDLDEGFDITVDGQGNSYMVGTTWSTTGMSTSGTHQISNGGKRDAFVVKINAAGNRQWATYFGRDENEYGRVICVDNFGNVYIAGTTLSDSLATSGAHKFSKGLGTEIFITKFTPNGTLEWCTYFGGDYNEDVSSILCDDDGNIYLSGHTMSLTGISTPGSFQPTGVGILNNDGFIAKFSASGRQLWGTYYGESGSDYIQDMELFDGKFLYMSMKTDSWNLASAGAYQTTKIGQEAAVILKFDTAGSRVWATYFGGTGYDDGKTIASDAVGNVYLSGVTTSPNYISTSGAYQSTITGAHDIFITKFSAGGDRIWGTYYGGTKSDHVYESALFDDKLVLIGFASSDTLFGSPNSDQPFIIGPSDAFLSVFDTSGQRQYSTYVGGNQGEHLFGITTLDNQIFVCGSTQSTTGLATLGAYQNSFQGQGDAFFGALTSCDFTTSIIENAPNLHCTLDNATYTWLDCSDSSVINGETNQVFQPSSNGTYAVVAEINGCVDTSDCIPVNFVGIADNYDKSSLYISPNPNNGLFWISNSFKSEKQVQIYNVQGEIVHSQILRLENSEIQVNLHPGLYFVEIIDGRFNPFLKLVIE